MRSKDEPAPQPAHWLWVTGPDHYLDEHGQDRRDLEPDIGFVPDGWWTCAPESKPGDLVFIYRSKLRKDIGYFAVIRSSAETLDMPAGSPFHGRAVCQYEILTKFTPTVGFATIAADPILQTWAAVKVKLVKSYFSVPDAQWERLFDLLGQDRHALEQQAIDGLRRIRLEKEVQQWLAHFPGQLTRHGLRGLILERTEYYLPDGGRADLVYTQGRGVLVRWVVVELKRGQIGVRAIEQVQRYRRLLDAQRPGIRATKAIVVGTHLHPDAARILKKEGVQFISLADLSISRRGQYPAGGTVEPNLDRSN